MRFSRNLLVSFVAAASLGAISLVSSTSCGPGFGSYPYPVPTWDGSIPKEETVAYSVCNAKDLAISFDTALMEQAPDRVASGENDIPLSTPQTFTGSKPIDVSCIHLRLERDASQKVTQRRLVKLGTDTNYTQVVEHAFYKLQKTATGWTEELDSNMDGVPEQVAEMGYDGSGAWTGTVTTTYSGTEKTPVSRYTSAPKDALTSALRLERWDGTTWTLLDDREVTRDQAKCVSPSDLPEAPPPPKASKSSGCAAVPCTPEQTAAIKRGMLDALKKVENCAPVQLTSKPHAEVATGSIQPICMKGTTCPIAETDADGTASPDRPRPLRVNVDRFGSDEFVSDIFHELTHVGMGDRGKHDDVRQDLAIALGKGTLVDPTYACEVMCFPPKGYQPTRCDCAACLDEDIAPNGTRTKMTRCSPTCSKFAKCNVNNVPPLPSPDTGSYCRRTTTFCDTVAECEGACSVNPAECGQRTKEGSHLPIQGGGNLSRACDRTCD